MWLLQPFKIAINIRSTSKPQLDLDNGQDRSKNKQTKTHKKSQNTTKPTCPLGQQLRQEKTTGVTSLSAGVSMHNTPALPVFLSVTSDAHNTLSHTCWHTCPPCIPVSHKWCTPHLITHLPPCIPVSHKWCTSHLITHLLTHLPSLYSCQSQVMHTTPYHTTDDTPALPVFLSVTSDAHHTLSHTCWHTCPPCIPVSHKWCTPHLMTHLVTHKPGVTPAGLSHTALQGSSPSHLKSPMTTCHVRSQFHCTLLLQLPCLRQPFRVRLRLRLRLWACLCGPCLTLSFSLRFCLRLRGRWSFSGGSGRLDVWDVWGRWWRWCGKWNGRGKKTNTVKHAVKHYISKLIAKLRDNHTSISNSKLSPKQVKWIKIKRIKSKVPCTMQLHTSWLCSSFCYSWKLLACDTIILPTQLLPLFSACCPDLVLSFMQSTVWWVSKNYHNHWNKADVSWIRKQRSGATCIKKQTSIQSYSSIHPTPPNFQPFFLLSLLLFDILLEVKAFSFVTAFPSGFQSPYHCVSIITFISHLICFQK